MTHRTLGRIRRGGVSPPGHFAVQNDIASGDPVGADRLCGDPYTLLHFSANPFPFSAFRWENYGKIGVAHPKNPVNSPRPSGKNMGMPGGKKTGRLIRISVIYCIHENWDKPAQEISCVFLRSERLWKTGKLSTAFSPIYPFPAVISELFLANSP